VSAGLFRPTRQSKPFPNLESEMSAKPELKTFEIREGDGNDGCYRRGTIEATDAFEALRKASRQKMIWKPKCVTLASMDGDDQAAYLTDYCHSIFGDAAAWCAEAHLTTAE
jgi:hypothetical protein